MLQVDQMRSSSKSLSRTPTELLWNQWPCKQIKDRIELRSTNAMPDKIVKSRDLNVLPNLITPQVTDSVSMFRLLHLRLDALLSRHPCGLLKAANLIRISYQLSIFTQSQDWTSYLHIHSHLALQNCKKIPDYKFHNTFNIRSVISQQPGFLSPQCLIVDPMSPHRMLENTTCVFGC